LNFRPAVGSPARLQAPGRFPWQVAFVPLLGLMWGFNWPVVKIVLAEVAPWTFRTFGLLVGGLLLAGFALARGSSLAVRRAHWPRLAGTGLLSIAAFSVLLAFAQLAAPTSRAAIVTYTMPIWASLFARVVLGERFDRRRLIGLALGAGGLAVLGWPLVESGQLSIGLLYALLGGMSWAAGTVLMKRYPIDATPLAIAAWQLLIAAACSGVGMLAFEGVPVPHALSAATLVAFGYHVLVAQALGYVLWFEIVGRLPAGISSLGTLMVPAVGVLGATLFVGEHPTAADYLGLVLIIAAAASVLVPARPGPTYASGGGASGN
jgi:drug/metabolite transporter (DMT)-like permease